MVQPVLGGLRVTPRQHLVQPVVHSYLFFVIVGSGGIGRERVPIGRGRRKVSEMEAAAGDVGRHQGEVEEAVVAIWSGDLDSG